MPSRPYAAAVARWTWRAAAIVVFAVGLAYRLQDFGRYGLWTDEAWVALATRVDGWTQIRLAAGPSPIGWVLLVRAVSRLGGPPEVVLRLVSLAFGIGTMLLAHRIGSRVAGHAAGGVVALAAVAIEPWSIEMSKLLKQYAAESCIALLTLDAACAVAMEARSPAGLAAVVGVGVLFANTQLLLGPPVFAALTIDAAVRRDASRLRPLVGWGLAAAAALALAFWFLIAPKVTSGLVAWHAQYFAPTRSVGGFLRFAGDWLAGTVAMPLGIVGSTIALGMLPAAGRAGPVLAGIVVALAVELLALGALGKYPLVETRVVLFYLVVVAATGAAALARAALTLSTTRVGRLVGLVIAVAIAAGVARDRAFATMGKQQLFEDLGPLVREVERARRPGEPLLLYDRSSYVYAYYAADPVALVPLAGNAVGYVPRIASATLFAAATLRARLDEGLAASPRVWVLGSRVRSGDGGLIDAALRRATILRSETRPRAFLVLVGRPQS